MKKQNTKPERHRPTEDTYRNKKTIYAVVYLTKIIYKNTIHTINRIIVTSTGLKCHECTN